MPIPSRGQCVRVRRWAWLLLAALVPCLTPLVLGAQEKSSSTPAAAEIKVIVLRPVIQFEVLQGHAADRDSHNSGSENFEAKLLASATETIQARKFTAVASESLQNATAGERLQQLQPLSSRLAQGVVNEEAKAILNDLATLTGNCAVLVQFMRIKKGPGGSWNTWTGQITSEMSSTILQASLISCPTGHVLWKNESVARKIYHAEDPNFAKWLAKVYQTLEIQRN